MHARGKSPYACFKTIRYRVSCRMTLRFVKTSVLSSADGIDFGIETRVENEETKAARVAAEQASRKPLFMQLAEQKNLKDEEFNANRAKIFAPPKGMYVCNRTNHIEACNRHTTYHIRMKRLYTTYEASSRNHLFINHSPRRR